MNIATEEWEVDYLKSEIITIVVQFCRLQGKGRGSEQTFENITYCLMFYYSFHLCTLI